MASDEEFGKMLARGLSNEKLRELFRDGLPDSQMQMLVEAGLAHVPSPEELLRSLGQMADDRHHKELPADIHDSITTLAERGNGLADEGAYQEALAEFEKAWTLLPSPKHEWEAATWILVAIGDMHFMMQDFAEAYKPLRQAMVKECPGARENPFIRLRRGQCLLELGQEEEAAPELASAYMLGGYDLFASEQPKYLAFLKTRLEPPADGWPDEKRSSRKNGTGGHKAH
jgi:tetratricopeptide (TPR) repeat protein